MASQNPRFATARSSVRASARYHFATRRRETHDLAESRETSRNDGATGARKVAAQRRVERPETSEDIGG